MMKELRDEMEVYLKTYMGYKVDPLNPAPETIMLRDIAHALSLICRGNGQCTHFYSVAQHCINAEKEAEARGDSVRICLGCLLHDGAEAYLADLIRPVKQFMPKYYEIEDRFLDVIYTKFGLPDLTEDELAEIKDIDDALLDYDLTELLKEPAPEEGYRLKRTPDIDFCPFEEAEDEYVRLAELLISKL